MPDFSHWLFIAYLNLSIFSAKGASALSNSSYQISYAICFLLFLNKNSKKAAF